MRKTCTRCNGDRKIANTERGEPWSAWSSLARGTDGAVRMGFVRPIPCPACTVSASDLLDTYAAQTAIFSVATRADEKYPHLFAALRGVLDVHVPEEGQHPDFCGHDKHELPCPTIRAITTALEAT
jgi:hypothetical protein